jgi:hypothetical protein
MARIDINLDFRKYNSHPSLIKDISPAFKALKDDEVFFTIDLNTYSKFLYSDFLTLVAIVVNHLKANSISVNGNFINLNRTDGKVKYATRVNFFDLLGIQLEENTVRHSSLGKFTEIKEFNNDTIYQLQDEINRILLNNIKVDRQMLQMLYYCLNEIMDNVITHTIQKQGFACAQLFQTNKEIRLIICDTGLGIHQSLISEPTGKYKDISEPEALKLCIQKNVTNGKGMGFGLFVSSEFIKENGGEMLIYSGNNFLTNTLKEYDTYEGDLWKGTIVFLKINTDIPVDYKRILPPTHTLPDDFKEYIEQVFGIDDNLW